MSLHFEAGGWLGSEPLERSDIERADGEAASAGKPASGSSEKRVAVPKVVRRTRDLVHVDGPPWKLLSPGGLLYILLESELEEFCLKFAVDGVELKNIHHLLGINIKGMNTEQPKHVKFWQPIELVHYLRRVGSTDPNEIVPVLGGQGRGGVDYFLDAVAKCRVEKDMPFNNGTQLKRLLAKTSDVVRAANYKWELAPPPEDPVEWHPRGRLPSQVTALLAPALMAAANPIPTVCPCTSDLYTNACTSLPQRWGGGQVWAAVDSAGL